jgi:hypothetical protein
MLMHLCTFITGLLQECLLQALRRRVHRDGGTELWFSRKHGGQNETLHIFEFSKCSFSFTVLTP